jgi:hypothetical protein
MARLPNRTSEAPVILGILKESAPGETRVALLPESLKTLTAQGLSITVESGAGESAGAHDQATPKPEPPSPTTGAGSSRTPTFSPSSTCPAPTNRPVSNPTPSSSDS